ncbi:hypothetical protein B0T17DRAFT_619893 [Bombardia bombarda]|uniref:Uncharacterized protein n=1 Tax=Bombardia bombarda TaxID=252184 RepID=A0AA39WGN9_9PEZI|nr:hypothetical protein B0T17DRAFT_619893 [Bombardia bombarda]
MAGTTNDSVTSREEPKVPDTTGESDQKAYAFASSEPTVEIAIVSTSLVTNSADLSGFDKRNWLVTAYLCAFTGSLLLVWAKLGHHIGLKTALLAAFVLCVAFSAGCTGREN